MPQGEPRRQQRARDLQARAADEGGVVGPLRLLFVCFFKRGGRVNSSKARRKSEGGKRATVLAIGLEWNPYKGVWYG